MTTTLSTDQTHDVRLDITVAESVWSGLYDRIEVWRSVLGEGGPYEELTASASTTARVPADGGDPAVIDGPLVNISGKQLKLLVNSTELEFTITGSDPLTFAEVATQVSSGSVFITAGVDLDGRFVVYGLGSGGGQRLEVLESDVAAILGLPLSAPDSIDYGSDPRLPLISGKQAYVFRDYYGKTSYFYKVRFRNSFSDAVSDFSGPIAAVPRAGVSAANMITGYVKLVRPDGQPDVKQEIAIYTPSLGFQIEGRTVNGGQKSYLTDSNGLAEVRLIRGMEIDLSIGGMNLMRRIVVPTDAALESFDMLSPEYGTDDTFAVQRLNIPYAEKRNL